MPELDQVTLVVDGAYTLATCTCGWKNSYLHSDDASPSAIGRSVRHHLTADHGQPAGFIQSRRVG